MTGRAARSPERGRAGGQLAGIADPAAREVAAFAYAAILVPSAHSPPCRGLPSAAMTAGQGGGRPGRRLGWLRRQYPQWRIWRGRATGDYWAMPPPGHPAVRELISSSDISELARRLAEAEGRHGL